MKPIAVTMRCEEFAGLSEVRDCLDQRWVHFLEKCSLVPVLIPNSLAVAKSILSASRIEGVLLTGGGDLVQNGGRFPQRDAVEDLLIQTALHKGLPLLGVCRGMQAIQAHFGVGLQRISGHVNPNARVLIEGAWEDVNSYHDWGTRQSAPELLEWARSEDGVIKAIRHEKLPLQGIMWHPERLAPFRSQDILRFQEFYR